MKKLYSVARHHYGRPFKVVAAHWDNARGDWSYNAEDVVCNVPTRKKEVEQLREERYR